MDRFVRLVVAGGVPLVAGLWPTAPFVSGSGPWLHGVTLSPLGDGGTRLGLRVELAA